MTGLIQSSNIFPQFIGAMSTPQQRQSPQLPSINTIFQASTYPAPYLHKSPKKKNRPVPVQKDMLKVIVSL